MYVLTLLCATEILRFALDDKEDGKVSLCGKCRGYKPFQLHHPMWYHNGWQ